MWSPDWQTRMGVHFGLFCSAVQSQGSVDQVDKWMPRVRLKQATRVLLWHDAAWRARQARDIGSPRHALVHAIFTRQDIVLDICGP